MGAFDIFIDGAVGTTGLRIAERLGAASDIRLISLSDSKRKSLDARLDAIAKADLTLLCLPDDAAKEIVALAPKNARICDTSTAHRTQSEWVYGLAELSGQRQKIQQATRLAVPGCHATGFITLIKPLVETGALADETLLSCHSLTGYSGGGKAMIAEYQTANRSPELDAPRLYGLTLSHKHLPEMQKMTGLCQPPLFTPVVGDFYSGMLVTVPLHKPLLASQYRDAQAVAQLLQNYYRNQPLVTVYPTESLPATGMLAANALSGKDNIEIFVFSNAEQILLAARFDNLGKGASGAAIQCLNLMLGRPETSGLLY